MLKSYFRVALRTLWRDRRFTAVNVAGLAVGMAVCLLMLLFIRQHWRTDRFHEDAGRLYRVTTTDSDGHRLAASPPALGPALAKRYAGVAAVARMKQWHTFFSAPGEGAVEMRYLQAGPAFFDVFEGFDLAAGREQDVLERPFTAVLSCEAAQRLFGTCDAVGKTFTRAGGGEFTVTGLLAERPGAEPSHLDFGVLLSYATLGARGVDQAEAWQSTGRTYTYLRLAKGAAPEQLEAALAGLAERRYPAGPARLHFGVQPVAGLGLREMLWNEPEGQQRLSPPLVFALAALALIVLVAAGFNYVNLTVARSLRRAKEIGVRKAVGALRRQVAAQLWAEALLVALGAALGAALLLKGLVPAFKNLYAMRFLEDGFAFDLVAEPSLALLLLGFGAVVGLLAGAYPALVLSRPSPARIFRQGGGAAAAVWKGALSVNLRKSLIALQLVFAVVLTISAALLYRQTAATLRADHGFRTEDVFSVPLEDASYAAFAQQAAQVPGVQRVTATSDLFLGPNVNVVSLARPAVPGDTVRGAYYYAVDSTFVRDMDLPLRARGPNFAERFRSGTGVVLDAAGARALGFETPQAALGQSIHASGDDAFLEDGAGTFTVAAVAGEVAFRGHLGEDGPLVLRYDPGRLRYALVRAAPGEGHFRQAVESVEAVWAGLGTARPYQPRAYATLVQATYGGYRSLSMIAASAAFLAVLIVCIGLAALAAYLAQTRVKEIGIRKALGASEGSIVRLLTGGFAALFAGAVAVGVPLAWLLKGWMLQEFATPVAAGAPLFAACVAGVGTLVLGVVGWQAWQAARIHPAEALRDE